jgi:hypothetical protein
MKVDNRPSIVTSLTDKDLAKLQSQANSMGLTVSEMADLALSEGIKQKFKRPLKGFIAEMKRG